jgi:hypothetical protein
MARIWRVCSLASLLHRDEIGRDVQAEGDLRANPQSRTFDAMHMTGGDA